MLLGIFFFPMERQCDTDGIQKCCSLPMHLVPSGIPTLSSVWHPCSVNRVVAVCSCPGIEWAIVHCKTSGGLLKTKCVSGWIYLVLKKLFPFFMTPWLRFMCCWPRVARSVRNRPLAACKLPEKSKSSAQREFPLQLVLHLVGLYFIHVLLLINI